MSLFSFFSQIYAQDPFLPTFNIFLHQSSNNPFIEVANPITPSNPHISTHTDTTHIPLKMHTSNAIPDETELITVHYRSCKCVKEGYRLKEKSANYPEPKEIWLDGHCWECEEQADREGAAAAAAAEEAARRRRAGLRGRLRGIVRGRKARVP